MLGAHDTSVLTGAPAASATYFTRCVMYAVKLGFWPTTTGHTRRSQRAILPVSFVGEAKALVKLPSTSRDLVPVTVTFSDGEAGSANACNPPAISRKVTVNRRIVLRDMARYLRPPLYTM